MKYTLKEKKNLIEKFIAIIVRNNVNKREHYKLLKKYYYEELKTLYYWYTFKELNS